MGITESAGIRSPYCREYMNQEWVSHKVQGLQGCIVESTRVRSTYSTEYWGSGIGITQHMGVRSGYHRECRGQ